ncbi:MAG: SixA phosphatase family protein [Dehalococcoidia bacterium]
MEICLVRHAIAEERGARFPDDSLRPLTGAGAVKMRVAAQGLQTLVVPEIILTSPYVRARQTAEILGEYMSVAVQVEATLASPDYAGTFEAALRTKAGRVLCVGHEPWLSGLLSWLLAGEEGLEVTFRKGAAALVTVARTPASGVLEWLLQPSQLRALAGR